MPSPWTIRANSLPRRVFIIRSGATLLDMIRLKPSTLEEMMRVSGMGEIKVEYDAGLFSRCSGTARSLTMPSP